MELKIKNINNLTVKKFLQLREIIEDTELLDVEKNVKMIALFCDEDEEECLKLSFGEAESLISEITEILKSPKINLKTVISSIKIGKVEYNVCTDINKFTVAQYIDFQEYIKGGDKMFNYVLSTIIVPKKHKYGEGYDINELVKNIDNLSIITARGIYNFFMNCLSNSTKTSMACLRVLMKKSLKKSGMDKQQITDFINNFKTMEEESLGLLS